MVERMQEIHASLDLRGAANTTAFCGDRILEQAEEPRREAVRHVQHLNVPSSVERTWPAMGGAALDDDGRPREQLRFGRVTIRP
jgi:hypothetical protein